MKKYADYKPLKFTDTQLSEAREYSIFDLLNNYGLLSDAKKSNKNRYWIKNPFSAEKTASFLINADENYIKEFNTNKKGYDTIAFVQKFKKITFVEAVKEILNISNGYNKANTGGRAKNELKNPTPNAKPPKPSEIKTVTDDKKLTALKFYYLKKERCISPKLAELHGLRYLQIDDYYYVGIENDKGGFELKNKFISKKTIGQKAITTIINEIKTNDFAVFEAFLDYFSYLELNKIKELKTNVIVLNGTGQTNEAIAKIKHFKQGKVFLALDNDKAGFEAANEFKSEFQERIVNLAKYYSKFKDVNECLQSIS